nr:DUF115 domain-containing protein [Candidatus Njordarchaeum guaymaensis]
MEFSRWLPWYERIASKFGYDVEKDRQATRTLRELLAEIVHPLNELKKKIRNKHVIIFGAGPSLENNLSEFVSNGLEKSFTLVVADGATSALLERSVSPHVVVTDLDGYMEDIIEVSKLGSMTVIHAHGDNIDAMREWVPKIIEKRGAGIFGTTQVEPSPPIVHNFGGFTDGDRATFLAEEMAAKTIILAGMDLGTTIGEHSKNRASNFSSRQEESKWLANKRAKLRFAKELLEWLATWSRAEGGLFNATGPKGETIKGFTNIEFKNLKKVVTPT